jgi:hypothetical protein
MRTLIVVVLAGCASGSKPVSSPTAPATAAPPPVVADAPPPGSPPPSEPTEAPMSSPTRDSDPYLKRLAADVYAAFAPGPGAHGKMIGCLQLAVDGHVARTVVEPSGDEAVDGPARRALATVEQQRAAHPEPVPAHLQQVVQTLLCYRFPPADH